MTDEEPTGPSHFVEPQRGEAPRVQEMRPVSRTMRGVRKLNLAKQERGIGNAQGAYGYFEHRIADRLEAEAGALLQPQAPPTICRGTWL